MERRLTNSKIPLTLLAVAAFAAVCFTVGAGLFLYRNTRTLVMSHEQIEHSDEVLLNLQRANQQADRIHLEGSLYLQSQARDTLHDAQRDAVRLQTISLRLKNLVQDNRLQDENTRNLLSCSEDLIETLNTAQSLDSVAGKTLHCQEILSLMTEQENELLRERNSNSRRRQERSVMTEIAIIAFSLSVLVTLFVLLVRDVLMRTQAGREWVQTNRALQDSHVELATTMTRLERRDRETTLLSAFRDELQLCATTAQVYHAVSVRFPQLLLETSGALCIINASRHTLETVATWGDLSSKLSEVFPPDSCCGLRVGQLRWRSKGESETDCSHFISKAPEHYVCVPLVAQGETLGLLYVECPDAAIMKDVKEHSEGLRQLVQLTAMAHASLELRTRLENQSIRDALTGLFNRHFMQVALDRELSRATRRKSYLAVFMIDVDHFKSFNDRFSHAAGDTVLKEVARTLQNSVRSEDIVCRYGGEEFTVILPDIEESAALERATSVRQAVESIRTRLDSALFAEVTISIGIAMFPGHGQTAESLLRQADAGLYRAKHEGRNRIVMVADRATPVQP